jgi:predicted LPLAT superfamily acyltransferase
MVTENWTKHSERGSAVLIKLLAFLSLRIGRSFGRAMLYPICVYFVAFAPRARRASRDYLSLALNHPPRLRDIFHHLFVHASVLLDRVFIMVDGTRRFRLHIEGVEVIKHQTRVKQGCILLGAHIGSFEILRSLADEHDVSVKVMMHLNMSQKFNQMLSSLNPSFVNSIIPLGNPASLIEAGEFVRSGGMVAILGDRTIGNERTADAQFFGRAASFPIGPLLLSAVMQVPIVFFVGLYEGDNVYCIHFEKLSDPPVGRGRDLPNELVTGWVDRYAQILERYCRLSPYNWFNFFDVWRH